MNFKGNYHAILSPGFPLPNPCIKNNTPTLIAGSPKPIIIDPTKTFFSFVSGHPLLIPYHTVLVHVLYITYSTRLSR
jgi:hypothetical protein